MPQKQQNSSSRSGFALVIALSMMAFVVVLLLSLTLVIGVETTSADINMKRLASREAAKLGLMQAIGNLQKYAGPDQRVTARADITGNGVQNGERFWTGVWESTRTGIPPVWLVSGNMSDPQNPPAQGTESIRVFAHPTDQAKDIFAPFLTANSSDNSTTEFAWWIADESVKASIGLKDDTESLDDRFFDLNAKPLPITEQRQLLRQQSPRNYNLRNTFGADLAMTPGEIEDIQDTAVRTRIEDANKLLERGNTVEQISFIDGFTVDELNDNFHDYTRLNQAVLVNTSKGGLKRDLSDQDYLDTSGGFKLTQAVQEFLWNTSPDASGNLDLVGMDPFDAETLIGGDPVLTTPIILTEFSLYCVISGERKNSRTARAFLKLEAEVWSPFGFRHNFQGASGSDTPEMIVEFENLPDLNLQFYDKDTEAFTNSAILAFSAITPAFGLDLTETHKSGEIRKTNGIWPINAASNQSSFYYTRDWSWTVDDPSYNSDHRSVSFPDGDSINYRGSASSVNVVIRTTDGQLLQRIENIPYGAIATDFAYYQSSPTSLGENEAPLVFHYRLLDSKEDLEKWFSEVDPRSINLDLSDATTRELVDLNDADGDLQGDVDLPSLSGRYSNIDFLHGQTNNNFFRLYDVPATSPVNLGVLQHLQFKDLAPNVVGSRNGNDLNDVFDRFFISGIPGWTSIDFITEDSALPNPFLGFQLPEDRGIDRANLQSSRSAQQLVQKGSFNVNSTSVKAWESVLSANYIYDWNYNTNRGTSSETNSSRINLESSFFRLPFSGHGRSKVTWNEDYDWPFPFEDFENETVLGDDYPVLTNEEKSEVFKNHDGFEPNRDWRPSAAIGHRELSQSLVQGLAQKIVDALQTRAAPFGSLEEFINSGLIDDAIAKTSINTTNGSEEYQSASEANKIPFNATAFLSQADVISALSPAIHTRGDTFKIRAAGSYRTLGDATSSTAYCEATIIRVPETVAPNADIDSNATGFGRQFKILDIRWLESSQL